MLNIQIPATYTTSHSWGTGAPYAQASSFSQLTFTTNVYRATLGIYQCAHSLLDHRINNTLFIKHTKQIL